VVPVVVVVVVVVLAAWFRGGMGDSQRARMLARGESEETGAR
jgi:hypothetical protein